MKHPAKQSKALRGLRLQLEAQNLEATAAQVMAYLRGESGDPSHVFALHRMATDAIYAFGQAQGERSK